MKTVLVLGATSAIVLETIKHYAQTGAKILLVGRDALNLQRIADDLKVRGASAVNCYVNELSGTDSARQLFAQIPDDEKNEIDIVYIGYGLLPDNEQSIKDEPLRHAALQVNFLSVVEHILQWFNFFVPFGMQTNISRNRVIAVISSVAGLRGRRTNAVYGAAKGGLNTFLSGLRSKGTESGVRVLTILPGFVDTPMTAGIKKGPLFASAEVVGKRIFQALQGKDDVLYVPWFWRLIMLIICLIPEKIFKKLKF